MTDLPRCRYRDTSKGEHPPSRFVCRSEWLSHGGTVDENVCRRCPYADRPNDEITTFQNSSGKPKSAPRGFGDTLAGWLARIGIRKRPGCGCEQRQATLNRWFPYRRKP